MEDILQMQIPVFQTCLWVFFGTMEDCVEAMRKLDVSESGIKCFKEQFEGISDGCEGMYHYNYEENIALIWMPHMPQSIEDYGALVHEIAHYAFYLFDKIGMTHSQDSDEAYAYLQAYVFKEIDKYIANERENNGESNHKRQDTKQV